MAAIVIVLVLVALGASSCGGGADSNGKKRADGARSGAERAGVKVIRRWADTLRAGDVAGASRFFSIPSVVSNGTPPMVLRSRSEVRAFNAALPCGARLLRTSSVGPVTTAVFRLTERPGPGRCGSGTGQTARTTFIVIDGKIREWRRVADRPEPSGPFV
jgi:hypothetical protein